MLSGFELYPRWVPLTHSDLFSLPPNINNSREKENVEVKCQILAKAMYSTNNSGVVGNWVILCTLNARKQNYSGAKWRLSCNVCWNLIHWKVSPWHRNVNNFEEREILNAIYKCPQSMKKNMKRKKHLKNDFLQVLCWKSFACPTVVC